MIDGDADLGVMPSGQVCGRIEDTPGVEALVHRTVFEAWSVLGSLRDRMPQQ
jgi:hypothetical protein